MIKITLNQLQQSSNSLAKLAEAKSLPIAACLRLGRLVKAVNEHLIEAQAAHAGLLKKYCKPAKDGMTRGEFKNREAEAAFKTEIELLGAMEVELLAQPFKIRDFGIKEEDFESGEKNTLFTAHDLSVLDWLIPLDESPDAEAKPNGA